MSGFDPKRTFENRHRSIADDIRGAIYGYDTSVVDYQCNFGNGAHLITRHVKPLPIFRLPVPQPYEAWQTAPPPSLLA